jgi:acyl-CoA thioester hydrolase
MTDPFILDFHVYYDDTDAGGVVYYANYLKFAERARTAWLRSLGLRSSQLRADHRVLIVVKAATIDYIRPAVLDDLLTLQTRATKMGGSSMHLAQDVYRGPDLVCTMAIVLVCVDAETFRPARWPDAVRGVIAP